MQPSPSRLVLLSVIRGTLCSGRRVAAPGSGARAPWRPCLGAAEASLADPPPPPPSAPSARVRGLALSRPFRSLGLFFGLTRPVGSRAQRSGADSCRGSWWSRPEKPAWGGGGRQYLPRCAGRGESGPSLPIAGRACGPGAGSKWTRRSGKSCGAWMRFAAGGGPLPGPIRTGVRADTPRRSS